MFQNLGEFIKALDKAGELKRITKEVSAHLEISQYTDQESKSPGGGRALLFEKVKDSAFPVATNIFGSDRRICLSLGVNNLDELGDRIRELIEFNPPKNLRDALSSIPLAVGLTRYFPRAFKGKKPPCQEVVMKGDGVDLTRLPVLHCWPQDAGPFVTLPLVITRSLETGRRNVGMYRLQIFDKNTTGMHWHIHKDGSHYFNEYRKAGKRMPVSVAIGADPATIYAATAPMPRGVDELILAGFIRKKPVRMVKCVTNDLEVPAEAEFVLEGYVDPGELRREGPFGDHTGYYSLADDYPVFHVTAVTHRRKPVYNATLVGRPPMEDCYLAKATERIFLPMLQTVLPEIKDYGFPWEGVFHNIVIVAIEKEFAGHAQKIMSGLWGQGQMSFCKTIVVVDQEINPQDFGSVLKHFLSVCDLTSDITVTKGILDVLDHSSPFPNFGHKLGVDLTTRFPGEPPRNQTVLPSPPENPDHLFSDLVPRMEGVSAFRQLADHLDRADFNRVLGVSIEKDEMRSGKAIAETLLDTEELHPFNIIIMFDADVDLSDAPLMLWKLFNNVDPERDIMIRNGRAAVDASVKMPVDGHHREWPDALEFDD